MKLTITKSIMVAFAIIHFLLTCQQVQAQVYNKGGSITVTPTAILYSDGDINNLQSGTLTNNGETTAFGSIINDSASTMNGDGTYRVHYNLESNGQYDYGTSSIEFFGDSNSTIKNKSLNIYQLIINKDSNYYLTLLNNQKVLTGVTFINDKNWIRLNTRTLTLGNNCQITGYSSNRYFITNNTGVLKKLNVGNSGFTFPVGFDKKTYNAVTITENGTPDSYSVRCLEHALLQGSTGDAITGKGINAGWEITEAIAGGANVVMEGSWKTSDELSGFDYTSCMLSRYNGAEWDFKASNTGTATGTPYRTIARGSLTQFGFFTVLSAKNPTLISNVFAKQSTVSKLNLNNDAGLKIYPTMVQNNFNIDVNDHSASYKKMNIQIIDASGKMVWNKSNADFRSQKILIPGFTSGIYYVVVNYGATQFVQKIMISH